ncbi:MAG: arsenate reductase [Sporocytophaga sp.]|uniref:arsenate reductase n=1 Tax=Sporocytophaga sp. TaxID=2231183 RepID=UPI001B0B2047|nr:arsenate reductase [Sporocytophaga sp.]MBO9700467.1 arsenate reductase [Sporocytophaga sp.]
MIVYGIKSCDTVKKSTEWLKGHNFEFEFHDYKSKGISKEKLREWTSQVSWEVLVNKKGTTWKKLDESVKSNIVDEVSAIELMREHTSLIKRPVIEVNGRIVAVGFKEKEYAEKLA